MVKTHSSSVDEVYGVLDFRFWSKFLPFWYTNGMEGSIISDPITARLNNTLSCGDGVACLWSPVKHRLGVYLFSNQLHENHFVSLMHVQLATIQHKVRCDASTLVSSAQHNYLPFKTLNKKLPRAIYHYVLNCLFSIYNITQWSMLSLEFSCFFLSCSLCLVKN